MAERRSLVEGIKPDPSLEQQFVRTGTVPSPDAAQAGANPATPRETKTRSANAVSRSPLTTRVRTDFADALKRASLQRQLDGIEPNTLQDILEEALEPWLRKNGYLQ
jgi:cell pole-organizing protein PopZ